MPNTLISQGNHARSLQLGINAIAGLTYQDHDMQYNKIFTTHTSGSAYEIDVTESGTPLAKHKPESSETAYGGAKQDFVTTYTHAVYSLGAIISMEAQMNNKKKNLEVKVGVMLKRSLVHTDEQLAADVINNAYIGDIGDGQPLASNVHILGQGGTFSNRFAIFTPLSQAALEDGLIEIEGWTDGAGLYINVTGVSLHVPRQLRFTSQRILKSMNEPSTANTATVNPMYDIFDNGYHINTRFTSATEWFIKTNIEEGFKIFDRGGGYNFNQDSDFGTENFRTKGWIYKSYGTTDPRAGFFSGQ